MKTAENNLEIRPFIPQDAASLYDLIDRNREELKKFWWEEKTTTVADSEAFIAAATSDEAYSGRPTRVATVEDSLIGVGSLHSTDFAKKSASLGYWIDKDEYGHGYATKIATALSDIAFTELGLSVVEIACNINNDASRAVAEHAGFKLATIDTSPTWRKANGESTPTVHYKLTH